MLPLSSALVRPRVAAASSRGPHAGRTWTDWSELRRARGGKTRAPLPCEEAEGQGWFSLGRPRWGANSSPPKPMGRWSRIHSQAPHCAARWEAEGQRAWIERRSSGWGKEKLFHAEERVPRGFSIPDWTLSWAAWSDHAADPAVSRKLDLLSSHSAWMTLWLYLVLVIYINTYLLDKWGLFFRSDCMF